MVNDVTKRYSVVEWCLDPDFQVRVILSAVEVKHREFVDRLAYLSSIVIL